MTCSRKITARLTLALYVAIVGCRAHHVPDVVLERSFAAHRQEFQQLVAMAKEDAHFKILSPRAVVGAGKIIDPTRASTADFLSVGLPLDRWRKYQSLFATLSLAGGVNPGVDDIWLRVEDESIWNGAIRKGYIYSDRRRYPCVDDLDTYVPENKDLDKHGGYIVYKHLTGPWYLFQASVG